MAAKVLRFHHESVKDRIGFSPEICAAASSHNRQKDIQRFPSRFTGTHIDGWRARTQNQFIVLAEKGKWHSQFKLGLA